jgi:putative hydrolase of the HAD superfamily
MIKAVLLDADGVVIKNHDYFSNRYKKDFGKSLNDDVITNFFNNEYKQTAIGKADLKQLLKERLNEWEWEGTVDELLKYWFEGEREVDKEVLDIANKLREKGIKVYLASDNEKYRAEYLLNKVGLKDKFDETFFSCFLGYTKSGTEFFKAIVKKLNLNPDEIVYFDDDLKNVNVAKKVGIKALVYQNSKQLNSLNKQENKSPGHTKNSNNFPNS